MKVFNYLIKIEYVGTKFVGWQYQKNGISVQEKIEKCFKKILKKKIKIHVRSIFLQGLIFLNYNKISKLLNIKSKKIKLFFTKYKTKEERIFNCLNYIKTRNFISNIIIGFTDIKELEEIIKIYKKKSIKKNYKKFIIYNKNIILPYLWKKNLKN